VIALWLSSYLSCRGGGEAVMNGKLSLDLSLWLSLLSVFGRTPRPFALNVCVSVTGTQPPLVGNTGMPFRARLSSCQEKQRDSCPLYHLPPTHCAGTRTENVILPSDVLDRNQLALIILYFTWYTSCIYQYLSSLFFIFCFIFYFLFLCV